MQPGAAVPAVARGDHDQASHLQRVERNMTHERVRQSEISDFAAVREKLRTIFLRSSFSICFLEFFTHQKRSRTLCAAGVTLTAEGEL